MTEEATAAHPASVEETQEKLRNLAVNIMRVVRGAGEPEDIFLQAATVAFAMRGRHQAGMPFRSGVITDALKITVQPGDEIDRARELIIKASLRIAAARLAGSQLQCSAAENDLFSAIYMLEEARAANRKKWL